MRRRKALCVSGSLVHGRKQLLGKCLALTMQEYPTITECLLVHKVGSNLGKE